MYGVVGAVDGPFVKIEALATTESLTVTEYYADQKVSGLNIQATASANYRFISVSIMCLDPQMTSPPSLVRRHGTSRRLRAGFFLEERLLTPYPGKGLREEYDLFNFYLSQQRIAVEQSFGFIVQTWGILWKPLRSAFAARERIQRALQRMTEVARVLPPK